MNLLIRTFLAFFLCILKEKLVLAESVCELRKVDPLRVTMTANRALCFSLCADTFECRVILYKDLSQHGSDGENGSNRYDGNCVLLPEHENNLLSERWEDGDGYKMCRAYDNVQRSNNAPSELPYTCLAQTNYNVTKAAHEAGFTVEVTEPSLGVTRFYKHILEDVAFPEMEDRCAAEGGILPQAYDAESIQALVEDGNVELPVRLGLKIDRNGDGDSLVEWMMPAMVHWTELDDNSCPQYSGWSTGNWNNKRTAYMDTADGTIKAGSFAGPVNQITCMFMGPNVALGKPVKAFYNNDNNGARSLLTDGDWNVQNELNLNFRGSTNNQNTDIWVAVDLEKDYLVNNIMFKSDTRDYPEEGVANYAQKTYTYCLVGPNIPNPGTAMSATVKDNNKLVFCQTNRGFTTGINTCSCNLILGKFVLLRQRNRLPMSEIAVFGVPFDGVTK